MATIRKRPRARRHIVVPEQDDDETYDYDTDDDDTFIAPEDTSRTAEPVVITESEFKRAASRAELQHGTFSAEQATLKRQECNRRKLQKMTADYDSETSDDDDKARLKHWNTRNNEEKNTTELITTLYCMLESGQQNLIKKWNQDWSRTRLRSQNKNKIDDNATALFEKIELELLPINDRVFSCWSEPDLLSQEAMGMNWSNSMELARWCSTIYTPVADSGPPSLDRDNLFFRTRSDVIEAHRERVGVRHEEQCQFCQQTRSRSDALTCWSFSVEKVPITQLQLLASTLKRLPANLQECCFDKNSYRQLLQFHPESVAAVEEKTTGVQVDHACSWRFRVLHNMIHCNRKTLEMVWKALPRFKFDRDGCAGEILTVDDDDEEQDRRIRVQRVRQQVESIVDYRLTAIQEARDFLLRRSGTNDHNRN